MPYSTYALIFRRYAPFATFGGGFGGDTRTTASTATSGVTARTIGIVMFDGSGVLSSSASSSGSHHPVLGTAVGAVRMTAVRTMASGPGLIEFDASTAGGNPLVPGAPDIDTYVHFRASISPGMMNVTGNVNGDDFPNLEVFVKCTVSGLAWLLVDGRTTGGATTGPMTRLAGDHSTQSLARFSASIRLGPSLEFQTSGAVAVTTI